MAHRKILYSLESLPRNSKIAIYGSGKIGSGFFGMVKALRSDITVSFYINTFNNGERDGLNVIKIGDVDKHTGEFDFIVVASSEWDSIEDVLYETSLDYWFISNDLIYQSIELRSLGTFRFQSEELINLTGRLKSVRDFFEPDDRLYFDHLVKIHSVPDESDFFSFARATKNIFKNPYTDFLDKKNSGNLVIEGGVADGTDSENFFKFYNNTKLTIYGFEPFIETYESSSKSAALDAKGMRVFPFALWDEDKKMQFKKDAGSATTSSLVTGDSCDNEAAVFEVQACKLDSFLSNKSIDSVCLIKLDIEGAEVEALRGATEIIRKFKPQLAISIYHKKEHLYQIPEFLKSLNPDYKFKLGFYSSTFIDTVLYAIN
jgi:FkbM family methyltransferase